MSPEHTHATAPTEFIDAKGVRFAYRRFGAKGTTPVLFNQHFQGTLDHWDPAVTDGLADTREVILFDNAGVSSSSGETPSSFHDMGGECHRLRWRARPDRGRRAWFFNRRHGGLGNRAPGT